MARARVVGRQDMTADGRHAPTGKTSEALSQTRLHVGERDVGRAFGEMHRQTTSGFQRRRRANRPTALRVEHGRITALERALWTQHFESRAEHVDTRDLTFMLAR
ncbi:hypothetical protein QFZ97_000457 [Paraburkholderia youngii]